jgi:hypothetical protein
LFLNAIYIDVTYGGIFAWSYLEKAGLQDDEILHLLIASRDAWRQVDDIQGTAERAMDAVGMAPFDCSTVSAYALAIRQIIVEGLQARPRPPGREGPPR